VDENEDLIARMEDLIEENDNLKQQLNGRMSGTGFPDGKYKSTPVSQTRQRRQHWEDLDERETSTQATLRNRSSGQRSVRSNASRGRDEQRYYEPQVDEDSSGAGFNSDSGAEAPFRAVPSGLRKSVQGTRKSSGNSSSSVAFDNAGDQVIAVPVSGSMRSSRSRVATPFVSGEAVDKLVGGVPNKPVVADVDETAADDTVDKDDGKHSQVNFETNVSVVEVPINESDEPGHHSRSVRGRIATPFIHDVAQKSSGEAAEPPVNEESQKPFPPPPE